MDSVKCNQKIKEEEEKEKRRDKGETDFQSAVLGWKRRVEHRKGIERKKERERDREGSKH